MDLLHNLRSEDLTVIGQSNEREVIFCYHSKKRRILCFDQHAVDERIRYERLLVTVDSKTDPDTIKSRACHGAIRFGDKLSLIEMQDLIGKLLKCKIPFRCAHSRCSVAILKSLDRILLLEKLREG